LNGIPHRVHRRRKVLTIQLEWLIPSIIRSNLCDVNVGSTPRAQIEVVESKLDDMSTGNCDIPDTSDVLREVVWKIWAGKKSSRTSEKFSRCTRRDYASVVDLSVSGPKSAVMVTIITIGDKHHLQDLTERIVY